MLLAEIVKTKKFYLIFYNQDEKTVVPAPKICTAVELILCSRGWFQTAPQEGANGQELMHVTNNFKDE